MIYWHIRAQCPRKRSSTDVSTPTRIPVLGCVNIVQLRATSREASLGHHSRSSVDNTSKSEFSLVIGSKDVQGILER